jgi:hypothetical protein
MIPIHWLTPAVAPAVVMWQESGENPFFSVTLLVAALICVCVPAWLPQSQ